MDMEDLQGAFSSKTFIKPVVFAPHYTTIMAHSASTDVLPCNCTGKHSVQRASFSFQ